MVGRGLRDLEAVLARRFLHHRRQRHRQQMHGASLARLQREYRVLAALDAHRGHGIAACAGHRQHHHAVAQVVADDGLDPVGEVGEEHGVRELAGLHRLAARIHALEDHPLRVHVHPSRGTLVRDGEALGGAVLVHHAASERRFDRRLGRGRERLASRPEGRRRDAQPSRGTLRREEGEDRGISGEESGLELVQLGDQLGQRIEHREAAPRERREGAPQVLP